MLKNTTLTGVSEIKVAGEMIDAKTYITSILEIN